MVALGIVRLAPLAQLPSVGISLGESGSDVFQITAPLRSSLAIFWEVGDLTQYEKNRLIVTAGPLLVISILSSLGFGFASALSNTDPQIGSDGLTGVCVGMVVFAAGVFVFVGGLGVFVVGFVAVGVGVIVLVGVRVGNTTCV